MCFEYPVLYNCYHATSESDLDPCKSYMTGKPCSLVFKEIKLREECPNCVRKRRHADAREREFNALLRERGKDVARNANAAHQKRSLENKYKEDLVKARLHEWEVWGLGPKNELKKLKGGSRRGHGKVKVYPGSRPEKLNKSQGGGGTFGCCVIM